MINAHRILFLHLICCSFLLRRISSEENSKRKRIAIIGDGVGGSFTSKYLADYDSECLLDITIYGVGAPVDEENSKEEGGDGDQGSRVSSLTLDDGTVVELGASIIFGENRLVSEMIDGDETLKKAKPHSPGRYRENQSTHDNIPMNEGMGIYDGTNEEHPWALLVANMPSDEVKKTLMWRYNLDLYRINKATQDALSSFNQIYDILDSMDERTFSSIASPNDVWRATGLAYAASVSFDDLLDHIGVASSIPWWRLEFIFGAQGLVRDELYTAINQCNNNQNNSQMTGLAGLVNSAASTGNLFAIDGGNDKIISSAIQQAQRKHKEVCSNSGTNNGSKESIKYIQKKIKTVVSDFEKGMELFDDKGKLLGVYDIVVLAAPLQFSGISFLGKGSLFDSNVLHPLSLNGMVENTDGNDGTHSQGGNGDADANTHGHRNTWGGHLPSSATRAYTKVVTTVVTNGIINTTHFSLHEDEIPRSIYFTEEGKKRQMGISAISQLIGGVYKIFSSEELTQKQIAILLGKDARIEHVKIWDKGATPAFNGGKEASYATDFLLYDGGHGSGSFLEESSALYYVNAMEAAVSAMEISAIGSKFVSKLIARRLGLITPTTQNESDEL